MNVKYCPRCPFFSDQFTKVVNHIGVVHSAEPNFSIFCGIEGCANSYKIFQSYRSHLYRRHKKLLEENGSSFQSSSHGQATSSSNSDSVDGGCSFREGDHQPMETECPEIHDESPPGGNFPQQQAGKRVRGFQCFLQEAKTALWNFFFNATEQHNLPHSVVEELFSGLKLLFEQVLKAYAEEIAHAVVTPGKAQELELLLKCSFVPELFKGLDKKRARDAYAKENFPFVQPEEVVVGQSAKYHYVPLPKLLSVLSDIPDIAAHFTTPECKDIEPLVYRDFTDGMVYREHLRSVITEGSSYTIVLMFYTDELDVSNPIGAKRGLHKLLAVYCSVLNIPMKYRSQLESIYLVMLIRYAHVKTYGLHALLQPLLNDLKQLFQDGLKFSFQGATEKAEVVLFAFCGDNLSLNRLGGFSCCFSRGRVCRFCMVSPKHLALKTSEQMCQLRTASRHAHHLQAIAINSAVSKRLYGVNEASSLLQLPYFDVTRQLPPDIMHDILEGGAECVLREVLNGLLASGLLSRRDLDAVSSFKYGPSDAKNKPVQINMTFLTSKSALQGTASSKWCLLRFLPFILGERIPEENEHWELLLKYREIVDVVFAPEVRSEYLAYLDVLVQSFLKAFSEHCNASSITPKLHYMVHYSRFIREVGPLKHLWSMRFEAKHQYFKKVAVSIKNFKNLTFSLANRHQLKQSHQLCTFQLYEGLETAQSKPADWSSLPDFVQEALPETAHQVQHAVLDHCKYRCGSVLVAQNEEPPEFHVIESLLVANGKLYILTRSLVIEYFERHRFCYHVHKSAKQQLHKAGEKFQYCLLDLYDDSVIVPKWEIW